MKCYMSLSSLLLALCSSVTAAQFTTTANINGGFNGGGGVSTWSGSFTNATLPTGNPLPTGNFGYLGDGGFDALDGYGYLSNLGSLTVQRQVDAFVSQNTYRWLDIFTNTTSSTITQTIQFIGDLGSDAATTTKFTSSGLRVTSDAGGSGRDPVLAHVSGLQSFTGGTLTNSIVNQINTTAPFNVTDDYRLDITLTLAAGESAGILNFLALARDASPTGSAANFNADVTLATTMGQNLLSNPLLAGLTASQLSTIRNFATPEPGTLALLVIGLTWLVLVRRRQIQTIA